MIGLEVVLVEAFFLQNAQRLTTFVLVVSNVMVVCIEMRSDVGSFT